MQKRKIISLAGDLGSGKSTVASIIQEKLAIKYIETVNILENLPLKIT